MKTIDFNYLSLNGGHVLADNLVPGLFNKDPVRHLVNEGSQNSTDATRKNFPGMRARLDYWLTKFDRRLLDPFGLQSAERHAAACREHDISDGVQGDQPRVLLFEDKSGGVEGPKRADLDLASALGRYNFSVGTGIVGKSGTENGRHGLGSGSGAMVSKIRTMYFTSTRMDMTTVASGRVSLASHSIDGVNFAPEARLGTFEGGLWQGVLSDDDADSLHRAAGFARDLSTPGLSCAVIDPVDRANGYSLLAAMLSYQFYQISKGEIEFGVRDDEAGIDAVLNAENIDEIIRSDLFRAVQHAIKPKSGKTQQQFILEDLPEILAFVRTYPGIDSFVSVEINDLKKASPNLRKAWLDGKAVGISMPLSAVHKEHGTMRGRIGVWMAPVKGHGYDIVVRDSIVNIQRVIGRMSLTIAEGDDIAAMIGDSEDPSHTTFTEPYARKRGWKDVRDALYAFRGAGEILHRAMAGEADKGDRVALARFFPMPGRDLNSSNDGGAANEESDEHGPIVVDGNGGSDKLFSYRQDRRSSTLTLTFTPAAKAACEDGGVSDFAVVAEYAGSRVGLGSFTDTNSTFSVERGAASYGVTGNELTVLGAQPDLKIVIRNVDLNRDLRIKHDVVNDMEEAA